MAQMGRRRLYLMRHGHVDYFAEGLTDFTQVPLTKEGRNQADQTGKALTDIRFDAVFSSQFPRTVETVSRVMAKNSNGSSLSPAKIAHFNELRGGEVVAQSREELAARLAFSFDAASEPEATFLPGGESFADAYDRVQVGLQELIEKHAWSTALLVAHDGINRLILGHICGAGLHGMACFEQDVACVNVLDFDVVPDANGMAEIARVTIKAVNLTAYDLVKQHLGKTSLEHLFGIDFGGARPSNR